jgi:hypothetical protein
MENKDYNNEAYNKAWEEANTEVELLNKKYRIEYIYTKEDAKELPTVKAGNKTTRNPLVPNNPKESFQLFKDFYAMIHFHLQKPDFIAKYRIWNKPSVKAEIEEIEKWINEAKALKHKDALEGSNKHLPQYEYLRLANGYYDGYAMTWHEHQITSTAANVYGRYFLFYEYLKEKQELYQYTSKYLSKIDITFGDIPKYIIQQGIIQRFEAVSFIKSSDYDDWKRSWLSFLKTIPNQYITKSIRKGIEFAQKAYAYHLNNECEKKDHCRYNESWERRIAIAEQILFTIVKDNQESRKDFRNWLLFDPAWKEVAWQYNTGRGYQDKQDLIAVFWNSYIYYQQKLEPYFKEFNEIPKEVLDELIFKFRQSFPINGRVEGVNYFDDLIDQLVDKYQSKLNNIPDNNVEAEVTEEQPTNTREFTTARQVLALNFIFEQLQIRSNEIDRSAKAEFAQFLTGKSYKNIYDNFQNPYITKHKNFRFEDLQFIRVYFEKLGLSEIVKAINSQLDKPR